MKISAVFASCILLVATPLFARTKTDVLIMNNGDHLTCEIKGLDAGVLYVSLDYVSGTTSVDWSKVRRVESKQLFMVKTEDGSVFTGSLSTPETGGTRPVSIEVAESAEKSVVLEQKKIVTLNETSNRFWQRFNGSINSGLIYSKGNQSTQYTFGAQAQYPRERWGAGASFNSTLAGSTGATTSTRNNGTFYVRRLLRWNNWFYTGVGDFLQSSEQGIALQSNVGGGIGRFLKNTNRSMIALVGGLAWQNTRYSQSGGIQETQNTTAALAGAEMQFFKFNKTNLTVSASAFPALSEPGRVYVNTNATYYVKFFGNFTWNLSFYGNWDNEPPLHFEGSNYGTSSGLGWTFGNK
ncbi:MAG TPA: DUF481 domain-containing protein [Acidobacteriaceae bacterium]|nr:DUF481 domain-containing protein [Acidobacteriaceae bacterium]